MKDFNAQDNAKKFGESDLENTSPLHQ